MVDLDSIELKLDDDVQGRDYLDLMFAAFGKRIPEPWFPWFNHNCPLGRSRIFVATDVASREILSTVCFLPLRIALNGRPHQGSIYVNAMTRPALQKRNLNVKLLARAVANAGENGDIRSITFPASYRASFTGMLKTGWTAYSDIHLWQLNRPRKATKTSTTRIDRFDARFDGLLEAFYESLDFAVWKDHHYLNWRLCDRPDQEYEIHFQGPTEAPRGFVVLKQFSDRHVSKTHIVELVAHDDEVVDELLQTAENRAGEERSQIFNTWVVGGSIYRDALVERGFERAEEHNTLMTHDHGTVRELSADARVHISLIDNDVF